MLNSWSYRGDCVYSNGVPQWGRLTHLLGGPRPPDGGGGPRRVPPAGLGPAALPPRGVVRRDVKLSNLLLDANNNNNIKSSDFGLGNLWHPEKKLNPFCGSPAYTAPELFLGLPYTGPEVDVWSLGVGLYTMLTGSLPFRG